MKPTIALYAPETYWMLPEFEKKVICNGCGPKGLIGIIVPESLWGLVITAACNIHDYMYFIGETIEDKYEADRVFLNNMLRIIDGHSTNWLTRRLRAGAAVKYYNAVRDLGGPAFWSGKNEVKNLG